jgi:YHS domain-containing protein
MKKVIGIVLAVAFCFSMAAGTVFAKPQETCPVMGGKINKSLYADHDGKRVYFCCAGCIAPFNKEPEKFIKQLEDAGVELDSVPVAAEKTGHEGHNH